tara:strand:- start:62 stop:1189 length:1128 start_codon:yes stop_codon:yes gene_type:complete
MSEQTIPPIVYRYLFLCIACLILFFAYTYRTYYYLIDTNNYFQNLHFEKLGTTKISGITSADSRFSHPLRDYYVLSSFNSCGGGLLTKDYVDTQPLIKTISRGARLLDFEIFQKNNEAVVAAGLGRDENGQCIVKGTFNHLSLNEVLSTVKDHAFSSTAPNPNDPLFLHFRFCTNKQLAYYQTGELIKKHFSNRLLNPKLSNNGKYWDDKNNLITMKLLDFKGKVIIICSDDEKKYKNTELITYINLSNSIKEYEFSKNSDILTNNKETRSERVENNKKRFSLSVPDITNKITNGPHRTHRDRGINFACTYFAAGEDDDNFRETIKFFEKEGTAFVLKPPKQRFVEVKIKEPKRAPKELNMSKKKIDLPMYQGAI